MSGSSTDPEFIFASDMSPTCLKKMTQIRSVFFSITHLPGQDDIRTSSQSIFRMTSLLLVIPRKEGMAAGMNISGVDWSTKQEDDRPRLIFLFWVVELPGKLECVDGEWNRMEWNGIYEVLVTIWSDQTCLSSSHIINHIFTWEPHQPSNFSWMGWKLERNWKLIRCQSIYLFYKSKLCLYPNFDGNEVGQPRKE